MSPTTTTTNETTTTTETLKPMIREREKEELEDLLINLKSISRLQIHEKLYIQYTDKKKIYLIKDNRIKVLQSLIRWAAGDSRERIIEIIRRYLEQVNTFLYGSDNVHVNTKNYNRHDKLKVIHLIPSVIVGLENMKATYNEDKVTLFSLENLIDAFTITLKRWDEKQQQTKN